MEKGRSNNFLKINTPIKTLRLHSLPEQSHLLPESVVQQPELMDNDIFANERYSRDKSFSNKKSRNSDIQFSKIEKGKQFMGKLLNQVMEELNKKLKEKQKIQIININKELKENVEFQDYIRHFFALYNKFYKLLIYDQQTTIPLDLKLKKKIYFTKQSPEKYSRKGQLEQALKENEKLKKQVVRLKETVSELQKRIIRVVTQYKQRKQIYLAQIQKLTNIINSSISSIPQLIIQKNRRLQQSSRKKLLETTQLQRLNLTKKQTEYNTLSNASTPLRVGLQNNIRPVSLQKLASLKRIRSLQVLRPQ